MHELNLVPILLSHFTQLAQGLVFGAQNYIVIGTLRCKRHVCKPLTLWNKTNAIASHDFSQFKCLLLAKFSSSIFDLSWLVCKTSNLEQLCHSLPLISTTHARIYKFQNWWLIFKLDCPLLHTIHIEASVRNTVQRPISQLYISVRLSVCQNGVLNPIKCYLLPVKVILLFYRQLHELGLKQTYNQGTHCNFYKVP